MPLNISSPGCRKASLLWRPLSVVISLACPAVGKTAEDGSGPLEPLEGFTCREGSKLGFATYEHNATGFSFEIGPASPISDDPEELGECGEGTGRDMIYRPLGLGRAAGVIPNWLQQVPPSLLLHLWIACLRVQGHSIASHVSLMGTGCPTQTMR